jgi:hypothetical protein
VGRPHRRSTGRRAAAHGKKSSACAPPLAAFTSGFRRHRLQHTHTHIYIYTYTHSQSVSLTARTQSGVSAIFTHGHSESHRSRNRRMSPPTNVQAGGGTNWPHEEQGSRVAVQERGKSGAGAGGQRRDLQPGADNTQTAGAAPPLSPPRQAAATGSAAPDSSSPHTPEAAAVEKHFSHADFNHHAPPGFSRPPPPPPSG